MSLVVVGELTADSSAIVLVAQGPELEQAAAQMRMELLTPLVKVAAPGALTLPASWAAVVQLSRELGPAWHAGPRLTAWLTGQVIARTMPPTELAVTPPPGLAPRSYQTAGACMIGATGRALIFDEPRTGKTVTTVLGLVERHAAGHPVLPVIVVCPAAVIDPWVEHVNAWTPWRAVAWRGTPKTRERLTGTAEIYVTSFETCRRDAHTTKAHLAPLIALGARFVVVDECHRIKDQTTGQAKAVRRLARRADGFVGLSGTPITHSPADLWPSLDAMQPGAWPSRERWVTRYCESIPGDYSSKALGLAEHREPEFRQTLLGQYRRIARADVLAELPKAYTVRTVELPPEYRIAYDAMAADMLAELPDGGQLSAMGVLAKLTRLAQLSSAAADVHTEIRTEDVDGFLVERQVQTVTLKAPSWKVDELLAVMAERPGYAFACFAPSRQLVMLAGAAAKAAGYRVGYVVGGQSAADRTAAVKAFQAHELDLLCATTGAGGTGLTLHAADALVFLGRPWSLVESMQAEDRAEGREDRERGTEVIDIVARNTIDTRVRRVLRERAGTLAELVQDPRIVAELLGGAEIRDLRKAA